jgi:hypothetical protein
MPLVPNQLFQRQNVKCHFRGNGNLIDIDRNSLSDEIDRNTLWDEVRIRLGWLYVNKKSAARYARAKPLPLLEKMLLFALLFPKGPQITGSVNKTKDINLLCRNLIDKTVAFEKKLPYVCII